MKKCLRFFSLGLVFVLIFAIFPTTALANSRITVTVNGTPVVFAGQQPVIVSGRTLVPVRGVFEQLGFDVSWDGEARQAILARTGYIVVLTIGSNTFTTNGARHTLSVPAQIIGGSTMLPLSEVLASVGYVVAWDGNTRTASVTSAVPQAQQQVQQTPVQTPAQPTTPVQTSPPTITQENITRGVWNGNVWTSEYLGMRFTKPHDWHVNDTLEWLPYMSSIYDAIDVRNSISIHSTHLNSLIHVEDASVGIDITRLYHPWNNWTVEESIESHLRDMRTLDIFNYRIHPNNVVIAGSNWRAVSYNMRGARGDESISYRRHFTKIENGVRSVLVITVRQNGLHTVDDILQMFSPLQ